MARSPRPSSHAYRVARPKPAFSHLSLPKPSGQHWNELVSELPWEPPPDEHPQSSPAGNPPDSFDGSQGEWAIDFAFKQLHYRENVDYYRKFPVPGLDVGGWSQVPFYVPAVDLGVTIVDRIQHSGSSELLRAALSTLGAHLVTIEQERAIMAPVPTLLEALGGASPDDAIG